MTVRRCCAPRIVKFESRFVTTVDVVHNLALLAGLLTYLHTCTRVLAHAHIGLRYVTSTHKQSQSYIHPQSHAHTHTYTHNHHIDT